MSFEDMRVTKGRYECTEDERTLFDCPVHGLQGGGTGNAHDGELGTWCYLCSQNRVKTPLRNVRVPIEKWIPGLVEVKCCGTWLACTHFTNTCQKCGADYNSSGQQLAPRECWGEETGETTNDILLGVAQDEAVRRNY